MEFDDRNMRNAACLRRLRRRSEPRDHRHRRYGHDTDSGDAMRPSTHEQRHHRRKRQRLGRGRFQDRSVPAGRRSAAAGQRIECDGAASSATFRVDVKNQLVIVMTRNIAGKNFGKYFDDFIKTVAEGIEN